ncbi:MAG: hypothetical protein QM804_11145 [Propionicimonas sp.]
MTPRRSLAGWLALLLTGGVLMGCSAPAPVGPSPSEAPSGSVTPSAEPGGPAFPLVDAGPIGVRIAEGDDWSLPGWLRPAPNSGFFSEAASARYGVEVRSVDVNWRQLRPTADGPLDRTATGEAQEMSLPGLDDQLADPGPFWMRLFASGESWAPDWVAASCQVTTYGPDYDGQRHLPLWNECVWSALLDTYRMLFVDTGLAADPRLRFVYVPGGFTWAEYDYDMIAAAVEAGDLTEADYLAWYGHAWTDLVELFGEQSHKLVFTGEDYPFGPFQEADDLLAQQAVAAGLGIRTGITELANFHLNEAPAYGSRIEPDGHLVVDETLPIHSGRYVVATENECYNDCGYATDDPYYAVRQSNLKALQLRMNWIYVVPGPSYFAEYPEHWDWVRLSIGHTAADSVDAWAAFRDAEDTYWQANGLARFADPAQWPSLPYVRNLERWLVQRDEPGSVAHRSEADVHREVFEADNGTAYEGLSTAVAEGDTGFVLEADPAFAEAAGRGKNLIKITYLDQGAGEFAVTTDAGATATVGRENSGSWRTATLALPDGSLAAGHRRLRIALADGADDLVVRFVRVVRLQAPE